MLIPQGRREYVLACNDAAQAAGVRPGMNRSAAETLAAGLRLRRRDPAEEARTLAALASWAQQFTPCVVLDPAPALLLEIGGCLRYFGGLPTLISRVTRELATLGHQADTGCAPTPQAALWLARAGVAEPCCDQTTLAQALARLPLEVLADEACLPPRASADFARLGLRTLGELIRLPRTGLARRFGPALPALLDRAWGRRPDPRTPHAPPACFEHRIELGWPADKAEDLLFVGRRLLGELVGFLRARGAGVERLTLCLTHVDHPPSRITVGLGRPTRQLADMTGVLRERLAVLDLPAPVEALTLSAPEFGQLETQAQDFFDTRQHDAQWQLFTARLTARLGETALTGIACVPEHRPERATQLTAPGTRSTPLPVGPRPSWLLPQPEPLAVRAERPWRGEPLHCQGRAERIEAGWWDEDAVARDYYLATTPSGRRYWIFQAHGSLEWFLHGIFA